MERLHVCDDVGAYVRIERRVCTSRSVYHVDKSEEMINCFFLSLLSNSSNGFVFEMRLGGRANTF